jgi:hypothetical protein
MQTCDQSNTALPSATSFTSAVDERPVDLDYSITDLVKDSSPFARAMPNASLAVDEQPMDTDPELPSNDVDMDPSPLTPALSTALPPSLRKARRDRAYRKSKRDKEDLQKRSGVGFLFPCNHPLCNGKKFGRAGFIDHM